MSTEWLHKVSCLSLTHLIYKTTKEEKGERRERTRRRIAKQDGDSCSEALPPFVVSGKTHFQSFPPVLQKMPRFRLVMEMDLRFNVHQLHVVVLLHSGATREVTNNEKSTQVFFHISSFGWLTEKSQLSCLSTQGYKPFLILTFMCLFQWYSCVIVWVYLRGR